MLLEKYKPKSSREIIGNALAVSQIRKWLATWGQHAAKGGVSRGALYVHGQTGTGKTLAVELLAREAVYELLRCGADEARNLEYIRTFLSAGNQQSLFFKKKLILIDDFEIIESKKGITELIKNAKCPVVMISSEYNLSAPLRKYCTVVKFAKLNSSEMYKFLDAVCKTEHISIDKALLSRLSRSGDARASLIDLEALTEGYRDTEDDIFAALRILFRATSIENVPRREDLIAWIEENIPEEYETSEEVARAYDYLSKADIYTARIMKRQAWSLKKYQIELSTRGVAMSKDKQSKKFVMYKRPRFYGNNDRLLEAIAERTHTSKRKARDYVQLINALSDIGVDITDAS